MNNALLFFCSVANLYPVAFRQSKRRENAFNTMGLTDNVKAMMSDAMGALLSDVKKDATPEEKLQAVMIAAKQSGMTVEKIFSYFKEGTTDAAADLTPKQFGDSLRNLSPTIFDLNEAEVLGLVQKFDTDGDGLVSYSEFRHYCYYEINAVCWRAERLRLEKAGEMSKLGNDSPDGQEAASEDPGPETIKIQPGEKIYEGNKLYWRSNVTIHIKIWHNSDLNLLTILCWSETDDKHFPPIFVDSSAIDIDDNVVNSKVQQLASDQGKQKNQDTHEQLKKNVKNDIYTSHILARLKVPDASNPFPKEAIGEFLPLITPRTETLMPFLSLLSTDKSHIVTSRPDNFVDPPPFQKLKTVTLDNFENLLSEVNSANKDMKKMTTDASRMTKLLDITLQAFKNAEDDRRRKTTLNIQQRRWLMLFTNWIVRQQVECVRKRLEDSPAYQELIKETEEKRLASSAGIELPSI